MKNLANALPFILLVSLVGLSFVKPDISVSISILGLAGLSGYKLYLESIKKPDYEKIFAERLEEINKTNKDRMDSLEKEIGKGSPVRVFGTRRSEVPNLLFCCAKRRK